jgi:hypothetical protein
MQYLQILISKKGTRVVTASNLDRVLQLPNQHYVSSFNKWLDDVYEFHNGIRKPVVLKDYAKKPMKDLHVVEDFYLSVELAKLITLSSKSKYKRKYAQWLRAHEGVHPRKKAYRANRRSETKRKVKEAVPAESVQPQAAALTLW